MEPMTMMFVASTAMSLWNSSKQSKAAEEQARHQQMLLNMKADEMGRRSKENLEIFENQGRKAIAQESTKFVGRYGGVGETNQRQFVAQSYDSMFEEMRRQKRRDDWDIQMTRMGADAAGKNAEDINKAKYWDMASNVMQSGMQAKQYGII